MDKRGVRAKWFSVMVYDEQYENLRQNLMASTFDFAIMCHDADKDEQGNEKRKHYHAVVVSDKREFQVTFAKKLGIDERFVQAPFTTEPNGAFRYLLHIDNPEKHQYSASELETNIDAGRLREYLKKSHKMSPEEKTEGVLQDIEDLAHERIGYRDFLKRNPSFIYQARSIESLVAMALSRKW